MSLGIVVFGALTSGHRIIPHSSNLEFKAERLTLKAKNPLLFLRNRVSVFNSWHPLA